MVKNRKKAIVVGILILLAYAVLVSAFTDSKAFVFLFEVISGLAVIGIAVLMFPYFKKYKKSSITYISLKFVEGILMVIVGLLFLSSQLKSLRDPIYVVHAYIFILSAFIFYILLFKTKIIPKWISIWGMMGSVLLLIGNLLEIITTPATFILAITYGPIVLNEIVLALWLIIMGFDLNQKKIK